MGASLKYLRKIYLADNRQRYPSLPDYARTAPRYSDRTANGLTKCILDFLKLKGWQAERVSVTGRYLDNSRIVTDVTGKQRRIGSGKWIPGQMTPGSADISAVINGRAVKIEVKIGRDQQNEAQRRYQEQIEKAGGVYMIATSLDEFVEWYQNFTNNGQ